MIDGIRDLLDGWRFWSVVSYVVLAVLVVWLVNINHRLNQTVEKTSVVTRANSDAIAYLCQTNAIVEALTNQTIMLLQSEQLAPPPSIPRAVAINVFEGYAEVLRDIAPCVAADKAALR